MTSPSLVTILAIKRSRMRSFTIPRRSVAMCPAPRVRALVVAEDTAVAHGARHGRAQQRRLVAEQAVVVAPSALNVNVPQTATQGETPDVGFDADDLVVLGRLCADIERKQAEEQQDYEKRSHVNREATC